jgi:uncharacterized protein (DUF1778 family)
MAKARTDRSQRVSSTLMVRLDKASKEVLARAAELRRISVSDYVRQVTVSQASKEVAAAGTPTIVMTADEQLAFWNALSEPARLTPAQKRLGKLMRGEQRRAISSRPGTASNG